MPSTHNNPVPNTSNPAPAEYATEHEWTKEEEEEFSKLADMDDSE